MEPLDIAELARSDISQAMLGCLDDSPLDRIRVALTQAIHHDSYDERRARRSYGSQSFCLRKVRLFPFQGKRHVTEGTFAFPLADIERETGARIGKHIDIEASFRSETAIWQTSEIERSRQGLTIR
ncbi:hypothetical protein JI59_18510 [Novosphingobium pentaromativorans US6-1]|nr:hypothetical protein JI59_18510 [Novosphingobium pentaromativorans US6-1]